jgi:hypothetical protein
MEIYETTFKYSVYHRENKKWLEAIEFYVHELDYFNNLLREVMLKNTAAEFKDEAKVMKNLIQDWQAKFEVLFQEITHEEWSYEDDAQGKEFLFGEEIYDRHFKIRNKYHEAENNFIKIKHSFYDFISKYI